MRKHVLGAKSLLQRKCASFLPIQHRSPKAAPRAGGNAEAVPKATPTMVYFPTYKGGHRNERLRHYFHEDMAYLLEADPQVLRWTTEVEPIDVLHDDNQMRPFIPSMRAVTTRGVRMVKLAWGKRQPKRRSAKARRPRPVDVDGLTYEFLMGEDLTVHPCLPASKEVIYHRPRETDPDLPCLAAAVFSESRPVTLGDLQERLGRKVAALEDLISLVAQGFIQVDLRCKVDAGMTVLGCRTQGYLS
ncbi:hypothetical protein [Muricoccus aerilatus]|uniref:hypothetical protein n=1 Tax=Muricoccus aerilatus TaxID=452982 RepID=UPI0012ECA57C|nr:hypothetical protein [Roseomonas aerilata]